MVETRGTKWLFTIPLKSEGGWGGRSWGGPLLMNIGNTPDLGGGVISALSFLASF